jgi:hypothetical protein
MAASLMADAAMTLSTEVVMIEIRALPGGRYEVFAEGLHQEAFEGCLGAIAVAQALASGLAADLLHPVTIATPWGERTINVPARAIERVLAKG